VLLMASGDSVSQIKERLSVVDVVSSYVELHPAGKNFKGKSPFTNEKTPSFYVSPDRGMYYCFSSSQGGDIFTFVQEMEGVDFKGALKILADKAGVELVREDPKKRTERDRQYDSLEAATKYFSEYLTKKTAAQVYLKDRGVKPETIAKWRIGYAPGPPDHGWRELKNALEAQKFTSTELLRAGLVKGADSGKEPYDLFRDRIMFPIFDAGGKVVAYSGRILTKDSEAPKYVNSPETELFNKSDILYGYDKAKQGIRTMDFSLIVEGQFDVVMAHQAGYSNTVAVSGTALTEHHVMLLQRLSNRVVLALDSDRAGIAAVKRAADVMLARGMDVKVAHMPDGEDPADMIQKDPTEFKHSIGKATHVIEFLLDVLQNQKLEERTFKLKAREEILPYVVKIPNRIDQEHFENLIAERLGTTKDAIHFETERLAQLQEQEKQKEQNRPKTQERSQAQSSTRPEEDPKMQFQRKKELRQYLAVLVDVFPQEQKSNLRHALEKTVSETLAQIQATLDATKTSGLSFKLESYIEATPIKQVYEETVDKLNELVVLVGKEGMKDHTQVLHKAETASDDTLVMKTLGDISAFKKKQDTLLFTPEVFGILPPKKLD
jgi:DNA primase